MAQIFHPSTNTLAKLSIFGALFAVVGLMWLIVTINRSSYVTQVGVARNQPVPFSHKHHANGLGIDCRYCHTSVEESAFAGIPPTKTCMTCHSQIWSDSPMLEPVRASYQTGQPLVWTRVHDLPDFVYFNHSIHLKKGVGCATCHGRVDQMPLVRKAASLHMEWCLDCHRAPERFVRPRELAFQMAPGTTSTQAAMGAKWVRDYRIESLTSCSVCHR